MSYAWYLALTLLLQVAVGRTLTTWPGGLYGLLKPTSGCPTGWDDQGWIFQDTVDNNPRNDRSKSLHMDGFVFPSNVLKYFCIKTNTSGSSWPKGQYCIYRGYDDTVEGMETGSITMYDEKNNNKDAFKMNIDLVSIHTSWMYTYIYTKIYFACNTIGSKRTPISLPITQPFYLLPYGSRDCQQVKWMVATSEWIKYHTRNYLPSRTVTGFEVPYHILGTRNKRSITMFYCYYESCNYTLTDKKGVFQSPGFPIKYPDGQLCSWRIMVPDAHILHVHFTNFSLDDNTIRDNLTFLKFVDGKFYLNNTFHGHHNHSFTVTATSDVLFEFLTNEEGNSTGFRAEYTVVKIPETTPSPPSTTRNAGQHTTLNTNTGIQHTTTIPTTRNAGQHTTLNTNTGILHTKTLPTKNKNKTKNSTTNTFKKSQMTECDGADITILIVIPLICLIVVIAVVSIFLYRWRSMKTKCEKCASTSHPNKDVMNPTYDKGHIEILQRTSTATMNTALGADDNDGRMYQALTRDQQPQYQAPDYSKQNDVDDPSKDSGYPEYHELEPRDNNVPDMVYDVLEGPDSNDGPSDDHMYQAPDQQTTHNPLYQSASPTAMVTRNPLYVDSVA